MIPRASVTWFAAEMERQLAENDWKGGWEHCSLWELYQRLLEEAGELAGVLSGYSNGSVIDEAADVANYAMMIADILHTRNSARVDEQFPEGPGPAQ